MTFKVGTDTSISDDGGGAKRRLRQANSPQLDGPASSTTAPKRHSVKRNATYPLSSSKGAPDGNRPGTGQAVVSLLGMPLGAKWLLYADGEIDRTVGMRDVLTYAAGNQMGNWAPRTVWCELFVVLVSCKMLQGTPLLDLVFQARLMYLL